MDDSVFWMGAGIVVGVVVGVAGLYALIRASVSHGIQDAQRKIQRPRPGR